MEGLAESAKTQFADASRILYYLCLQATKEGQASHAHVHEIIKGLKRRGWTVRLFEPSYARRSSLPSFPRRLIEFIRVSLHLMVKMVWYRPDCLYIRHHPFVFPVSLWARILRIPQVLEVNGCYDDLFLAFPWATPFRQILEFCLQRPLHWANWVVTVTEPLVEWVRQRAGHSRVALIPNGANADLFVPEAREDPLPPEIAPSSSYVIFFGALAPWQGIEVLLSAVADCHWPPEIALVIIGDGKLKPQVLTHAQQNPLIRYVPPRPYDEMPRWIARSVASIAPMADIPRNRLGVMPLKVFESLACGVPVIVSDLPGMADLVNHYQCGIVVPPSDAPALAQAVARLVEQPDLRRQMGQQGRTAILSQHSWDKRAEQTHLLLAEVLEK